MGRGLRKFATLALGWGFVLLGVAGIFLPILQGILFLLVGLWILSTESPRAKRWLDQLRRRYPRLSGKLDEAHAIAGKKLDRLGRRFRNNRDRKEL
ncbi:MAG: DUF454 family protein [Alphaproteobacteria bacterium]|jgi:uncharacterized membrane protein YbaN (DUF454 family)